MKDQGFTLLEVMIALAVLAIGAAGFMSASNQSLRQYNALEVRFFASWIADNKITELRSIHTWADYGATDEKVTMAGRQWEVHTAISLTPNAGIRKVEVTVSDEEYLKTAPLLLTGFLGKY